MTSQVLSPQELDRLLALQPASSKLSTAMLDSPILKLLASTDRESLSKSMTERHYKSGEIVFKENDIGDAMYIIRSGRVLIVKGDFKFPTILSCQGVGAIVGEMALLENRSRSASVVAIEDLHLLRIDHENFQQIISNNPSFEMSLMKALSTRLRTSNETLNIDTLTEKRLIYQVSKLQTEKQQLLELQRRHQDTMDLIIHDLRNPLSLIFGAINMLEIMLPEDVLKTNQELLELANVNCEYLQRLIDSLLDVAQIEAGQAELLLTNTDLPHLIQKTVDRMTLFLNRDDITLHFSIPPELPTIVADEDKIDRVLTNLIDNAVKYTLGGGEVTIAVKLQDDNILVSITNPGDSISPEDREHIFDRFAQASGNKSKNQGFGLGLAFCRMAVEAHGGRIWAEPGEGGSGNRFAFSLPLSAQLEPIALAA